VEKSLSVSRKISLHSEVDKSQKAADMVSKLFGIHTAALVMVTLPLQAPEEPWNPTFLDLVLGRVKQQPQQLKEQGSLPQAVPLRKLLELNKPEWYFVVLGIFAAAVLGAVQPTLSIIFSRMLEVC